VRISWLPRNIRVVDLASAVVIMSLGFLINVMYFTAEYFERTGSVLAQVWAEPVEHALVIAMAPLYLAIGRLYWQEKKSKKELEASNKLKDLFTDVLRHDLLNPVGVIQTSSELLEESSEDKELVSMIKRQAWRLEDLISNASKLAKMEYQEELSLEDLDLADLVKTTVEEMSPLAQEKRIELIGEFDGRYFVKANPIFREVLVNLISNAIKYGPTDSHVTVALEDRGSALRIKVIDHGPGIPDVYKEDVFKRFTRKEKGAIKGTGLGLAIAQRIVDMHKGRVWVEDNTPRGSIFTVELTKR